MSEIEKLNMIAEWQEQHKQLIEDLNNSKKRIATLEKKNTELQGALELYEGGACRAENHSKCKLVQQLEKEIENYKLSEIEAKEIMAEQEEQIEKMKCGQNCKHSYLYQEDRKCKFTYCDCINCKDKWELRR